MIRLEHGDCIEILDTLEENSIDAVVTDPPYELGFMGKSWDASGVAFCPDTWGKVLRVMKPGAHLVAFGAPKNYHRLACAIEDAGFEIRDSLMWVFGSGFPKSHNLDGEWAGWGTALKPAYEPIVLARKPLSEGTVAANVLRWGTGALNIDATRVGTTRGVPASLSKCKTPNGVYGDYGGGNEKELDPNIGRWPANLCHDGSQGVLDLFPYGKSGAIKAGQPAGRDMRAGDIDRNRVGGRPVQPKDIPASEGSAARFFYCAKASKQDRAGSKHPTVKPINLMRWLVRMVTPPGGTVLDPFGGSGTTGQAAIDEGFNVTLIEREAEYINDIKCRLGL